jgi:hypothetical protein
MACTCVPIGTHWAWHVLNAAVLSLALTTGIRFGAPRAET